MKEHKKLQELLNKPEDCKSTHIYSDSSWYAETLHDFKKNLENRALIIPQYIIIIGLFIIPIVFFLSIFCDHGHRLKKFEKCWKWKLLVNEFY